MVVDIPQTFPQSVSEGGVVYGHRGFMKTPQMIPSTQLESTPGEQEQHVRRELTKHRKDTSLGREKGNPSS